MWFEPHELVKNEIVTLCDSCDSATPEIKTESRKVAEVAEGVNPEKLIVTCYTPSGIPIDVVAKDAEHAAFLARMNPQPLKKETTHD